MLRTVNLRQAGLAGACLAAAAVVACGPTPMASEDHDALGSAFASESRAQSDRSAQTPASVNRDLAALRRATAQLRDTASARAAGYEVLVTHPETGAECLSHDTHGAMGYHFLNPALVNDEVVVDQPEVILYEKGPNGKLRIVAVEYIIPFSIRGPDEPPPVLFGREFVHNNTFDLWMLHAWVWKNNPSGIFADWNPNVSCD